jgi:hypothetical protein
MKVSIVYTTAKQAPRLEAYLIKTRRPPDNPDKYEALTLKAEHHNAGLSYQSTPTTDNYPF